MKTSRKLSNGLWNLVITEMKLLGTTIFSYWIVFNENNDLSNDYF